MINRIFKTILVLSIVLGITLPSNAAVSVSDGSAFVTKAEFAADLNNLSNRMAQLENSLDAKIDSLVSSYLTRNGIWNGKKQTLTVSNLDVTGTGLGSAILQRGVYYSIPNGTTASNFYGNYELVNKIDKSGLLTLTVVAQGYAQATRYGQHYGNRNVGTGNIYVTFNVGNVIKYTASIGRLDSSAYADKKASTKAEPYGDYLILATTDLTTVAQFFVQKDDKLDWDVYCYYLSNGYPEYAWGQSGNTNVSIASVEVY